MSYVNDQAQFSPAGEIQELSFDEIEQVDGAKATVSTVLAVGAAITGGAALVLAAPAIVGVTGTAAAVYGATSAVMALGSALAALRE